MKEFYNTLVPYMQLDEEPIQYGVCRDFDYISRYRGLRQIVHNTTPELQFVTLETPNPFVAHLKRCNSHTVTASEENRLDIIAKEHLGSAMYAWVIAYINNIADGYTVLEGQKLLIPRSITDLLASGEFLENIPVMRMNLGSE